MFGIKKRNRISNDNGIINILLEEKKELQKRISLLEYDSDFVKGVIHMSGDLIHYQFHDYEKENPLAALVFSQIGTILRSMANEPERHRMKVSKLAESSDIVKSMIERKSVPKLFNEIQDFTAIHLIDMVSRMQGQHDVNDWKLAVHIIKKRSGFNTIINNGEYGNR